MKTALYQGRRVAIAPNQDFGKVEGWDLFPTNSPIGISELETLEYVFLVDFSELSDFQDYEPLPFDGS